MTSEVAKQIFEPEFRSRTLDVAREGWLRATARGDEPVEMPLPPHPHAVPHRDIGAPQTSNHDVCATRDLNVWSEKKRLEKLNYMHNNPVNCCLVKEPGDWAWSSWRFYYLGDASVLAMARMPRAERERTGGR